MPIAAAGVAVLAALTTMMTNQRANQAIIAKNGAIVSFMRSSDTYNYYQAKSIREDVYRAAVLAHGGPLGPAQKIADLERTTKATVLAKAVVFERQAQAQDELSDRFVHSYETLEVGVAFLEVSIVILSIASLVGTLVLPAIAACTTVVGIGFALAGLPF